MAKNAPEWICSKLGAPAEKLGSLLIDNTSAENYTAFINYISHRGVNIDEPVPAPSVKEGPSSFIVTAKTLNVREYPGELSALIVGGHPSQGNANVHFGLGYAHLQHEGQDIYVVHEEQGSPVGTSCGPAKYRVLYVYARMPKILRSLYDVVAKWFRERRCHTVVEEDMFDLYTLQFYPGCDTPDWESRGAKMSRSLDSVILPDSMLQSIVKDVSEFNSKGTRDWYIRHGLPYRRSFLFYGKPGTGKSSTIRALAGALRLSACFLSLGDRRIGNLELQSLLSDLPAKSLLVIEDIDALFNENRKSDNPSQLTFSGLLNSLDGLISEEGMLTIMTTNHIERLDPALIRAGRVDRKFEFKPPTMEVIAKFFKSFYPDASDDAANEFATLAFERPEVESRSLATLQEHFIYTRGKNAEQCIKLLDEFFTEFYPRIAESNGIIGVNDEKENAEANNYDTEEEEDESNVIPKPIVRRRWSMGNVRRRGRGFGRGRGSGRGLYIPGPV